MSGAMNVREFFQSLEVADVIGLAGEKFITVLERHEDNSLTIGCSSCPSFKLCGASPIRLDGEAGIVNKDGDPFDCFNVALPKLHEINKLTLEKGEGKVAVKRHHEVKDIVENHKIDGKLLSELANKNKGVIDQVVSLILRDVHGTVMSDAQSLLYICGLHEASLTNEKVVRLMMALDCYARISFEKQKMSAEDIAVQILEMKLPEMESVKKAFNPELSWTNESFMEFYDKNEHKVDQLYDMMQDSRFSKKTQAIEAMCRYIGLGEGELTKEKIGYFTSLLLMLLAEESLKNSPLGMITAIIGI